MEEQCKCVGEGCQKETEEVEKEEEFQVELYLALENCNFSHRPEITLLVNGHPMLFLVDSGAERTVIRDIGGLPKSNKTINVLSASGKAQRNYISAPITMQNTINASSVLLEVVLSPQCPHNLLGRDALLALELAIVPTVNGCMEVRNHSVSKTTDTLVVEGRDPVHYYWTLDIPVNDPSDTAKTLLNLAKQHVDKNAQISRPDNLHVTLRYKRIPGPDDEYDKKVHKLGPQNITLTHFYFKDFTSFCDVQLTQTVTQIMPDPHRRHVSVSKSRDQKWSDLGMEVLKVRNAKWKDTENPKIQISPDTGYKRLLLNWKVNTQPNTRLGVKWEGEI